MKKKKSCDLKSCFFCRLCMKERLPAIDANRKSYKVNKGELLFNEGDKVTGIYFVNSGCVKVHKKCGDKELILRFAKNGDIVGHRGLGYNDRFPISATALEPTTICFIEIDFFLASLKVNHDYLYQLMMFFAEELKELEKRMRNLAHMPAKGRIANALLTLRDKFGTDKDGFTDILLSSQDIAAYTGTTYETLFRALNELIKEKIIDTPGKKFRVLDAIRLRDYCNVE